MIKRLDGGGLLEHAPYRGVRLTRAGRRKALEVLRRHRILETYLCEKLGYSWDDVHMEAERLEHAASEKLIERMAAALGSPSHDPHGSPIPARGGRIEAEGLAALADAVPGLPPRRILAVRKEEADGPRPEEDGGKDGKDTTA